MATPFETEYEHELIRRGQKHLQGQIDKSVQQQYYTNTKPGRYTFQKYVEHLGNELEEVTTKAIADLIKRNNISRICSDIKEYAECFEHGYLLLASVTLKTILDSYARSNQIAKGQDIAADIGRRIEKEVWFKFEQDRQNPTAAALMRREASMPGSSPHYRYRGAWSVAQKAADEDGLPQAERWRPKHRLRVGLYMLDVANRAGIIKWNYVWRYGSKQTVIYSDAFMNEIMGHEELVLSRAFYSYPLLDKPLNWSKEVKPSRFNTSGGYHLHELRRDQRLCRSYISDSVFGDKAIDLLNTLQSTAWRVDRRILEVAEHCNEKHIAVKSFLVASGEMPSGKAPEHWVDDPDQTRFKEWKRQRHEEFVKYQQQTKRAYRTRQSLSIAKEFEFKTFFLSWSCDWRGRYYTQQAWLSPQTTDFEKSLMKFRDGCKLNADSIEWCRAAIGAAYNGTRISHQDRIQWTHDNQKFIQQIAEDPRSTINEWEQAKEPWQFLQLCMEWNDVVITGKEKFWKVPVGADSTASGLQLLSAMRRDPVGMKCANLLPPDTPSSPPEDAYMRVLEVAKDMAMKDETKTHLLPYLEYRSIGKPAVMLSVYGGCHRSIKEDIEDAVDEIKDELEAQGITVIRDDMSKLTTLITSASKKVFPAAYQALSWLKKLANQAHENGRTSLTWTTPTEDEIHLVKYEVPTITVETAFNGRINIGDWDLEAPNTKKQVSSFAPSFVHSYDAALLKEAFSNWSHPIALIHDCIRVLPNDMDRALDRIKDAFTSVVDGDPLARLADELEVSAEQLKRKPQLDQDLSCIQHSKYMFN